MTRMTLRSSIASLALLACAVQPGMAQSGLEEAPRQPIKTIIVRRTPIQQTAGVQPLAHPLALEPAPAPPAGDFDGATMHLQPAPAAALPPRTPVRTASGAQPGRVWTVSQDGAEAIDESGPNIESTVSEDGTATAVVPLYPQTLSPMYPCPQPNIPYQVGGTAITNQALAPHEMLYPHTYRALYGPFYYKVKGGWFLTPFGVRSHETWRLTGTEVEVKYHSRIRPSARFHPPVIH